MKAFTRTTGRVAVLDRADVDTDQIIPKQFLKRIERTGYGEFLFHDWSQDPAFELNRPEYAGATILVTGRNFGCGSSREAAPRVIKAAGIAAVVAASFARIFFRNSINIGLPVLACDTRDIGSGDEIEVDLASGQVRNLSTGASKAVQPLPKVMMNVIADGGLVQHIRKHGTYRLD